MKHSEIIERLHYDPLSGELRWTGSLLNRAACRGKIAGCKGPRGYSLISIDGVHKGTHVVIWFYMTGYWPENDIDHRDRNPSNNIWENLREATRSQNSENKGFSGLSWHKRDKYWNICLSKDGIRYYDRSKCFGKALMKRHALKQKLHTYGPEIPLVK